MNILIVNDTLADSFKPLQTAGYQVQTTSTTRLDIPNHVVLILIELQRPNLASYQLCHQLKAGPATKDIPMIMVADSHNSEHIVQAFQAGCVDYISKPFHEDVFLARIRAALQHHAKPQSAETGFGPMTQVSIGSSQIDAQATSLIKATVNLKRETSARQRLEATVREHEQLQELLFRASSEAIIMTDSQSIITTANPASQRLLGYAADELIGQRFQTVHANAEARRRFYEQFQKTGHVENLPIKLYHRDGELIDGLLTSRKQYRADGTVANIVSAIQQPGESISPVDTSLREALDEAEAKFNRLAEQPLVGIYIIQKGKFVYRNEKSADIFGYSKEEALDWSIFDSLGQNDRETVHNITLSLERNKQNIRFVCEGRRKDGSRVDIEVHTTRTEYQGKPAVMGIVVDITKQKEAERLLEEYNRNLEATITERTAELVQAKQAAEVANETKGAFLASMSHELRSPLNAILGFAQLIDHNQALSQADQEYLTIIRRSGEHLLTLINDVLDMSKIEAGQITLNEVDFDLYHLLEDVQNMFQLKAEAKSLPLVFDLATDLPQLIHADELKLRQVLINLLSNATKFTETGSINVNASLKADPPAANSSSLTLQFDVADTGPGIAEAEIGNLFEAFAQTATGRQAQEGTGLGLSISHKFVELMGGKMSVQSKLGEGTTFSFTIQIAPSDAGQRLMSQASTARQVIALEPGQPRYRILIVDDKWTNRHLLVKLLGPYGFELKEAENGQQAVELWETFNPHLIWMDIRMPIMDGYKATQHIKAQPNGQETVIIALTASVLDDERALILEAGCDDFMQKPFREADIFEAMHRHIGVRYVYEETATERDASSPPPHSETINLGARISALPNELLLNLKRGAELSDMNLIESSIEMVRPHDGPLAAMLKKLADSFRYDELLRFIQTNHD